MLKSKPAGHRVLVKPDLLEDVDETFKAAKSAGIALLDSFDEIRRERNGIINGTLVAIGDQAWKDFGDGSPWAKIGDRVMFAPYAGKSFKVDDITYLVMNDQDILCVAEKE